MGFPARVGPARAVEPPPCTDPFARVEPPLGVERPGPASWTEAGTPELRPGSYVYGDAQQVVLMVEAARAWWDLVAALGWQASGIGPPPAGQTWSAVSSLDRLL